MKKAICIPFAFEEGMNSGVNLTKKTNTIISYLKNACVALVSAKKQNLDCDVILATNMDEEMIPNEFLFILKNEGILFKKVPFNSFRFKPQYKWALAFYKLCVLKYLVEEKYDKICYLDTDVYIQGNFDAIWDESDSYILLYDINHGLNTKEYVEICKEFTDYYHKKSVITHYGGEFFCANYNNAKLFIDVADKVYLNMIERSFETMKGDEFIVSIVANEVKKIVKNASPYICRFWTGVNFRLVSECYINNPVLILHIPSEKERGILKIFDKYVKYGKLPNREKVWKICRLNKVPIIDKIAKIIIDCYKRGS